MIDRRPERRALQIFAFDPMLGRAGDHRITIEAILPVDHD